MKKKMILSLIGGILLSAVALFIAFKNVEISDLINYLGSINYFWMLLATMISLFSFVLRAVRWRIILESTRKISIWRAFHPLMIGFMINCVLPGRLGEVARPVILQKEEKVPFPTGLATVVAERVFDVCLLILLFMLTRGALNIDPDQSVVFKSYHLNMETLQTIFDTMLKLGALLITGIVLFSVGKIRQLIYSAILLSPKLFFFAGERFKALFEKKVCEPVINILKNIAVGFTLIRYPKKIILCAVFSVLIWLAQAYSYYLVSLGSPGIKLTYFEITSMMVIICLFISLPSVPGWWGLWEAGGVFALSLFGIAGKDAAGYTLANHAVQVIPVIFVGIVSAMILSVNIRKMSFAGKEYRDSAV